MITNNKYIQYMKLRHHIYQDFRAFWFVFLFLNVVSKVDEYSITAPQFLLSNETEFNLPSDLISFQNILFKMYSV